ncbi:2-succinyl-5-enolpyruvyl-6-hydroxy-3-cyclohexene-1-carboxylic-acid synthase [Tessaracoccus sp. OH4464_COT-324]|uniref:2-succinyl-5-enolpyruvyl-6-hydroxy-3- cyclohexene-1-carboxylic-acid synthase n=1 Tax=Tessaracoccus sp. OH4464_COT-324 TaxID=2491059 RepID=UPI00131A37F3|nr:2-succinyl-5-enolpyruvyl-6-hydroxy-3-cyclohexene-1-carboxylic-acid synthase [Tessaracoccus sp. OH4464_COT-324]
MHSVELGSVIAHTLAQLPVVGVVSGAGSRNAPLSLAFHQLAEELALHVAIDERSGAFRALGLAKASGKLAVISVTSGSAVANLAPAILEAKHAGVALLVITADRPMQDVGTGSSQTTNQVGIFGSSVIDVVRLSSESGTPAAWSAAVQRAAHLALGTRTREPGPVQLNVEFTPPLVGRASAPRLRVASVTPSLESEVVTLPDGPLTVVVAGDASWQQGQAARRFAEAAGVPLLAEPSSNARAGRCAIANYRSLLGGELGAQVQRVVVFGHPTLSRPQAALLSGEAEVVVVSDRASWHDAGHRASLVADRVALSAQPPEWLSAWQQADAGFGAPSRWGGRQVADALWQHLTGSENLVLGASSIIRDADLTPVSPDPPRVYASRGQAGIDGTVATASGIALATGRPTTVLLGDLAAQHDIGSLARAPLEEFGPVRVVVADDNGGGLFHRLEQAAPEYSAAFERVFATPQQLDLVRIAAAFGWRAVGVGDVDQLRSALAGDAEFIVARYQR